MKDTKQANRFNQELRDSGLMPIFEILVKDIKTGEDEYILCDIYAAGRSMIARRDSVSERERRSKKIAFTRIPLDSYFDLQSHLESLHDAVLTDIIDGGIYEYD